MDTIPGMTELRLRREALVLESELNRRALRVEIMRLEMTVDRFRHGLFSGRTLWKWLVPAAGFFVARKFGGTGPVAKGSALLAVGQSLWNLWRSRRGSASGAPSSER